MPTRGTCDGRYPKTFTILAIQDDASAFPKLPFLHAAKAAGIHADSHRDDASPERLNPMSSDEANW
ncbi:MAG TPA: hypothetical protein VLI93_04385, partial [Acetobacteraceae bacterium]|nr:hypothetical protein [Acetobacteraceae bacterium]